MESHVSKSAKRGAPGHPFGGPRLLPTIGELPILGEFRLSAFVKGGPYRLLEGTEAIKALSWKEVGRIVAAFQKLNPYDRTIVPGSILNIVEEINFDSTGKQRPVYGYDISAKRYALYTRDGSKVQIIKASEHGLGLYYRPKEGRDSSCDVPVWIREGWEWILRRALGIPCEDPDWFRVPVMRRIAISTPNVMAALRRLNRDQARPYNFALSPVLVNLSGLTVTLLGRFEKDSSRWEEMTYVNIHDGGTHTLKPPTLPVFAQTFGMAFAQYIRHPESKSLAPDESARVSLQNALTCWRRHVLTSVASAS